jgi:hypothetical protein
MKIDRNIFLSASLCKLQKRCSQLAAASDKVYQLLAHGRWFSAGTRNKIAAGVGGQQTALILIGFIIRFQPNFNNNTKVYDVRPALSKILNIRQYV